MLAQSDYQDPGWERADKDDVIPKDMPHEAA